MKNLTYRGVAYNLATSPYIYVVNYNSDRFLEFVFSSNLNREKFSSRKEANREKINKSLSKRFSLDINIDVLADIKLYTAIEKRGFLIRTDKGEITCQEAVSLTGISVLVSK